MRITQVRYLDQYGREQSADFAGWDFEAMDFIRRISEFSEILGQGYIERPWEQMDDAPDIFTAVDLRSADGIKRMIQEFAGDITDARQIRDLVGERLGSEGSEWRIVNSCVLRRTHRVH